MIAEENAKNIEKALAENGFIVAPVHGDSMLPMLDERRDAVRLAPISGKLKKYDLPLYRRPNGKLVMHRIIEVKRNHYIICGDNRKNFEKVPHRWMVGVMEGFYKDGRYIPADDGEYLEYVEERCRDIEGREIFAPLPKKETPVEWTYLISLLRVALVGGEAPELPDGIDLERLFVTAKRHMVASTVSGIMVKLLCGRPEAEKWKKASDMALRRAILFDVERAEIYSEMEKAGIKYMPLKGIIINTLYPKQGMREFADNDILYDVSKQVEMRDIMHGRGYIGELSYGVHDTYHKDPVYNFEMHKALFSSQSPIAKEFDDPWRGAIKTGELSYAQTDEDFYVYYMAHFYKHYSVSGAGLRSFADLWLIKKRILEKEGIDKEYISRRIAAIGIEDFERDALDITEKIFVGDHENITPETLRYIMNSGAYGSFVHRVEKGVARDGKFKYIVKRAFPPCDVMVQMFPVLEKAPVLLPGCWCIRLSRLIFIKRTRTNMKNECKAISRIKK